MSKWNWKKWLTFGIFGALLLTVVILIPYGILTHEEPGFTNADNRWDHVPLVVTCVGYVAEGDEACPVVEDVVSVINSRLGFELLKWRPSTFRDLVPGDIHVSMRAPVEVGSPSGGSTGVIETSDDTGGVYELTGQGNTYEMCKVRTMNVSGGAGNLEWLVVYHELGHCIGLAHDDYEQSIMYPEQQETPARTIPSWISDDDRGILRDRYLP